MDRQKPSAPSLWHTDCTDKQVNHRTTIEATRTKYPSPTPPCAHAFNSTVSGHRYLELEESGRHQEAEPRGALRPHGVRGHWRRP